MRQPFYQKEGGLPPSKQPLPLIPQCGACGIYKQCKSPKMPVGGKGKRGILIIGGAPGESEDSEGVHFVGDGGVRLRRVLDKFDVDMRRDCWLTNALICHPPDNKNPNPKEIGYCRPNLRQTIDRLKPTVVIPLGELAVKSLLGLGIWKEDVGKISRWVGWKIPCRKPNSWICPTYDPKDVLNEKNEVVDRFFENHLEAAIKLKGRPWEKIPDDKSKIQVILDVYEAKEAIAKITKRNRGPMAFDYETDRKKPDSKDAQIVSCSISDGKTTIAFPWHQKVIRQMEIFLESSIPKIAANIDFENRWTNRILGMPVNNWLWDTMNAMHWIDCRPDITGLKFQSFALLGAQDYDSHVRPLLHSDGGGNSPNKIKKIPLENLLLYNGLDSLYEWQIARKQMRSSGYGWPKD